MKEEELHSDCNKCVVAVKIDLKNEILQKVKLSQYKINKNKENYRAGKRVAVDIDSQE